MTGAKTLCDAAASDTVSGLLVEARQALAGVGIETAAREAAWLLAASLGTTQLKLHVDHDRPLTPSECAEFRSLVSRRKAREPLQYILNSQEFCGLEFEVTPDVLIPRPESETLVEAVTQVLEGRHVSTIVDVGAGSGCLAVTLATMFTTATIYAIDCSAPALAMTMRNILRHSVERRVTCVQGDLCLPLEAIGLKGRVGVIVSNPPYVREDEWSGLQPEIHFEPRVALVAGKAGTEIHRRLLRQAWCFLVSGGWLFMEIGMGQAEEVRLMAQQEGRYGPPTVRKDAAGIDRVIGVQFLGA